MADLNISNSHLSLARPFTIIIYVLVILSINANEAAAQNRKIDSLLHIIRNTDDTARVNMYTGLASELLKFDLNKSKLYSDSAIQLGTSLKYYKGVVRGYRFMGISSATQGEHLIAKEFFKKTVKLGLEYNLVKEVVRGYSNLSTISVQLGEFDSTIHYSKKSLELDSTNRNKILAYMTLGSMYRLKPDFVNSLYYHQKSLSLSREMRDKNNEIKILHNISNVYCEMKEFDQGLNYLHEALAIVDTVEASQQHALLLVSLANVYSETQKSEKALRSYQHALGISRRHGLKSLTAQILVNIGTLYNQVNNFDKAINTYTSALHVAKQINYQIVIAQTHTGLAESYVGKGEINESRKEALKALALCDTLKLALLKIEVLGIIYRLDSIQSDYKRALANYKEAKSIEDSIFNAEKNKQLLEIKEKYETEKKAEQIAFLEQKVEKEKSETQLQKYRTYSIGFALVSVTALFTFLFFMLKRKREKDLQKQIVENHKAVIQAQEETQEKISRDLHDNVGQKVVALKFNLENAIDTSTVPAGDVLSLINDVTSDIRTVSHSLSAFAVLEEGISDAINKLLKTTFDGSTVQYAFEIFNLRKEYSSEIQINLYRIAQELISNIIKHANANCICVQLYQASDNLMLIVEDDGIGFDSSNVLKGYGLRNIEKRARMLNGTFNIESTSLKTTVTIGLPV